MPRWNEEELKELWRRFFREEGDYGPLIREGADNYPQTASIYVSVNEMVDFNSDFADHLLEAPRKVLSLGREAMKDLMHADRKVSLDIHVNDVPEPSVKIKIRDIRATNLEKLISVEGLVRRVTEVRPKIVTAVFKCQRCAVVTAVPQPSNNYAEPLQCSKDQGGCGRTASSTKFILQKKESVFIDTQSIEMQEYPEGLRGGAQPQRLTLYAEGDLADQVYPGDRVTFHGILKSRQIRAWGNVKSPVFEKFVVCVGIERSEEEYEEIKISPEDKKIIKKISQNENLLPNIVSSIAPSIYGMEKEKLALALQLFGGVRKETEDGYLRGDIHILLVGDPGTAKSQLLNYLSKMSPRGIFTTGKSATAAGLTAAAVPDETQSGRWNLEAGALVLADRGVACIDEIDKMSKSDQTAMHEALEQQRISITKAGIQATLQSRCSVLGAANPKHGRFKGESYSLMDEITILDTILDRFDLIFTIRDEPEAELDEKLATHVLNTHLAGEIESYIERAPSGRFGKSDVEGIKHKHEPAYDRDILKKYIAYAKKNVFPVLSGDAVEMIKEFYVKTRGESTGGAVTSTPRQLEALIRLTEACARAHLSDEARVEHAKTAIDIVKFYLRTELTSELGVPDIDLVSSGMSYSQRNRVDIVLGVLGDLEEIEEYRRTGVPQSEVVNKCAQKKMKEDSTLVILRRLSRGGEIFSKGYRDGERMWNLLSA